MSRSAAVKLNDAVTMDGFTIADVKKVLVLHVENDLLEKDEQEYNECIVVDGIGTKYITSSEPFTQRVKFYAEQMKGESEEWGLLCTRQESKNNAGTMILCDII